MLPRRPAVAPGRGRLTGRLSAILSLAILFMAVLAPAAAAAPNEHAAPQAHDRPAEPGGPRSGQPNENAAAQAQNGSGRSDTTTQDEPDEGDNRHPSGNDKEVEAGQSGAQGNTTSDPDDDGNGPDRSNGGADKPGGPGGVDRGDQDANNGCGNDDDFEDDNEGLCLGRQGGGDQGGGGAVAATLSISKTVTGDGTPTAGTLFDFTLVCDGETVTFSLADGGATTWAAESGDEPIVAGDECTLTETDDEDADEVTIEFNGSEVGQDGTATVTLTGGGDDLDVTNDFDEQNGFAPGGEVGGEQVTTNPEIDIVKLASTATAQVGDEIVYTYLVTNVGDVRLTEVELDDDVLGDLTGLLDTRTLDVFESTTVTTTQVLTSDDVGILTNVATTTGVAPGGERVSDTATATVDVAEVLGIVIEDEQPGPDAVIAGPDVPEAPGAAPVAGEAPGQAVAAEQVAAADELPRTGVSSSALVLLALSLLGAGVLAVRAHGPRVRPD
jgi:uncharacterized repeat protein (TIGR01451 family)